MKAFYGEDELIDGKAPTGAPVECVKEESYFFKLSNYTQKLLDFYKENPDFVGPESRINEVISFVGQEVTHVFFFTFLLSLLLLFINLFIINLPFHYLKKKLV